MKIKTLVYDYIEDYLEDDPFAVVRDDMKLSKFLTIDDISYLVQALGEEIGVDIPPAHNKWLKTVGDLVHIFTVVSGRDELDDYEPPVLWRGEEIALRKPILCEGASLKIFEVINDPVYGRIFLTYHGFIKRYAYTDTCTFITDPAIIDNLDNKYGRPISKRDVFC